MAVSARRESLGRDLVSIRSSLRRLERAVERLAGKARAIQRSSRNGGARGAGSRPRRKLTLSPQRRAQLKLQGQYMGFMRQLSEAQKKRVRSLKESRGHRAAIAMARSLIQRG